MEKKLTNSGPLRESADKHSIYTIQQYACGKGYLRAADVSSFCTLADGVVRQMLYCTDNGC